MIRTTTLLLIFTVLGVGGCAAPKPVPAPNYAGITRSAGQVSGSIDQARADSREIKAMHLDSMGLLDRLDHKAVILLDQ